MIPVLVAGCFGLALVQRPGEVVADTKIDLHVDPARLPGRRRRRPGRRRARSGTCSAASTAATCSRWGRSSRSATPRGIPMWVVQRLWLGAVLRARGVGRRAAARRAGRPPARRAARGRRRALRAQPVRRRLREPHVGDAARLRRAAVAAAGRAPRAARPARLVVARRRSRSSSPAAAAASTRRSTGVGAARRRRCSLVYERPCGRRGGRASGRSPARRTPARARLGVVGACRWSLQARYGLDFLPFTEQPGTIWAHHEHDRGLRLMGFWPSYLGVGFGGCSRPYLATRADCCSPPVVVGVAAACRRSRSAGFAWTRRWRYAPFFLAARCSARCS